MSSAYATREPYMSQRAGALVDASVKWYERQLRWYTLSQNW